MHRVLVGSIKDSEPKAQKPSWDSRAARSSVTDPHAFARRFAPLWRTDDAQTGFLVLITSCLLFALVLHPRFAPAEGSFHLHFGPWGDTPGEALRTWLSEPGRVLAHLAQPRKASYLPRVLAPLALRRGEQVRDR